VSQQVQSVKSAVKASTRKQRKATSAAAAGHSTAKKAKQDQEETGRSTVKKGKQSQQADGRVPLVELTPAQQSKQPLSMATPAITPKFNTRTPLSRTVARVAKPTEVLLSLSGSPVVPLNLRSKVRSFYSNGTVERTYTGTDQ
jgi:hypothetical protein